MERNGPPDQGEPSEVCNDNGQIPLCTNSAEKIASTRSKQSTTKPKPSQPSRRQAKRKRTAGKREVALYDGTNLVGTVKIAADGRSTAYDVLGKRVGSFGSLQAASDALGGGVDG
jgi:hypothetical protein